MRILKYNNIDLNEISFSEPKLSASGSRNMFVNYKPGASSRYDERIVIQTPTVRLPFGVSEYKGKYSIDMSVRDSGFLNFMKSLDEFIINYVVAHSTDLFGKPMNDEEVSSMYRSSLKQSKNQFPDLFKAKLFIKDDTFEGDIYDANKKLIEYTELEKGVRIQTIMELVGIYIIDKEFGTTWKVSQIKVIPNRDLKGYSFVDED